MKKNLKIVSLLLALVMVLVACSTKDNKKESKKEDDKNGTSVVETETTEKEKEAGQEQATIVFWHAMNGAQEEALVKMTEAFKAENPNINVDLQNQGNYGDLQQKLITTSVSPKNLPTLTQAYPNWVYDMIQDGLVHDLSEYVKTVENYEDIIEGFRKGTQIDGKTYSMPFNKSTEVLWYNQDLFDELKLKLPTNFEELKEVSKKIYEAKGIPGMGVDSLSNFYLTYLNAKGVEFGKGFNALSPESKEAVQYYLDGVKEGYFRIAGTDKYMSAPFGNQQVAMYIGSNAGESYVVEGVAGKFKPNAAKAPYPASFQQGTDVFVFEKATDAEKQAAYKYLSYITSKQAQIDWGKATGYIPVRNSAVSDEAYKNSGSIIAPILQSATEKLFVQPLGKGSNDSYNEARVMLESVLADPANANVDKALEAYQAVINTAWSAE